MGLNVLFRLVHAVERVCGFSILDVQSGNTLQPCFECQERTALTPSLKGFNTFYGMFGQYNLKLYLSRQTACFDVCTYRL